MRLNVSEISRAVSGKVFGNSEAFVTRLVTDSRDDMSAGGMFCAIIGEKTDGHKYIKNVADSASAVLLSNEEYIPDNPGNTAYILVKDVPAAMLDIGKLCRSKLDIPIISVTGSVGKTTTREMTAACLSAGMNAFRTPKNFNGQIGLPVTLMSIENEEIAVLEAGVSIPGEMARLSAVINPDVVLMTKIGVSHIEYLGSRQGIFEEKFELAKNMGKDGCLIVNGDDDILGAIDPSAYPFRVIKCGFGDTNDVRVTNIARGADGSSFTARFSDEEVRVSLGVLGDHMVTDALLALTAAKVMGVNATAAAEKLAEYSGYEGRQRIEKINGVQFICDYYNASPDSMVAALKVLSTMECPGRRIAVLGNMNELGPDTVQFHREVGEAAADLSLDCIFTVGELAKNIGVRASDRNSEAQIRHFADLSDCANSLCETLKEGDCVLLKASNSLHFGKLIDIWKENSTQK